MSEMSLGDLANAIENFGDPNKNKLGEFAGSIAGKALTKVKRNTPVGVYEDGRTGGTLRDSFKASRKKTSDGYEARVISNEEYGAHVEYGHRTRKGTGKKASKVNSKAFVPGKFFLKKATEEVERDLPKYVEGYLEKAERENFR